jgi:hypothetical protein
MPNSSTYYRPLTQYRRAKHARSTCLFIVGGEAFAARRTSFCPKSITFKQRKNPAFPAGFFIDAYPHLWRGGGCVNNVLSDVFLAYYPPHGDLGLF